MLSEFPELEKILSKQKDQETTKGEFPQLKGLIYIENIHIHLPNQAFGKALSDMAAVAPLVAAIAGAKIESKQNKATQSEKQAGRPRESTKKPEENQLVPLKKPKKIGRPKKESKVSNKNGTPSTPTTSTEANSTKN